MIIITKRIFMQEFTLQRVVLLSMCVLIKLNRKRKNSKNLTFYKKNLNFIMRVKASYT